MARIRRGCFRIFTVAALLIGLGFIGLVLLAVYTENQTQSATRTVQAVAVARTKLSLNATASIIALTPTDTPTITPTPSKTFTPTITLTPSQTYTPTITLTPSRTYTPTRTPTYILTPSPTLTTMPSATEPPAVAQSAVTARVLVNRLNVREFPGTGSRAIGQIFKDEIVILEGRIADDTWVLFNFNGTDGWISASSDVLSITGNVKLLPVYNLSVAKPPKAETAASGGGAGGSGECPGFDKTCSELTCEQAYACLRQGNRQLDGNGDGIPCNAKCR